MLIETAKIWSYLIDAGRGSGMTKAVFLSDAHLKNQVDDGYHQIMKFLDFPGDHIDDLFILGDLFDFWFCRDSHIYPGLAPSSKSLPILRRGECACTCSRGTTISSSEIISRKRRA